MMILMMMMMMMMMIIVYLRLQKILFIFKKERKINGNNINKIDYY
jgi:hypothetical protein